MGVNGEQGWTGMGGLCYVYSQFAKKFTYTANSCFLSICPAQSSVLPTKYASHRENAWYARLPIQPWWGTRSFHYWVNYPFKLRSHVWWEDVLNSSALAFIIRTIECFLSHEDTWRESQLLAVFSLLEFGLCGYITFLRGANAACILS